MEFSSYRRAFCSCLRLVLTLIGVHTPYPGPTHLDGICLFVFSHIDRAIFVLACENIRFSSLFAAGDVSRGGTSETQWQKFHTDDANQCLHNKPGSHRVPNLNLSGFTCLLVDFGKVLCSSAKELQQNSNTSSREDFRPINASDRILDRFYVISMEFLSLSRRRFSARNVPIGEERGETDVSAG